MTTPLSARLIAGTATNEDVARSRGWRCDGLWNGPRNEHEWSEVPDFLNDIRLTLADLEAKGWAVSIHRWARPKNAEKAWQASVEDVPVAPFKPTDFYSGRAEAPTAILALLIAFALATEAEEGK
jgi:hypothetical protein